MSGEEDIPGGPLYKILPHSTPVPLAPNPGTSKTVEGTAVSVLTQLLAVLLIALIGETCSWTPCSHCCRDNVQLLRQQTWHVCLYFTYTHTPCTHTHTHCPRSPPPVALPEGMGHHHRQCGRHGDHGGLHLADRQPCVGNNAAVLLPSLPLTHTHSHT